MAEASFTSPTTPTACAIERRILGEPGEDGQLTGDDGHDDGSRVPFATSRELEHAVLHLLAAEDGPLGSGTLMERLQDLGYAGSEPTVGRFLRNLDRRGLTTRVSNRGRDLTDEGRQRLRQLCESEARRSLERGLIETIRVATIDDIYDVLVARRALERETARLAAERATAEDIAALEEAIRSQRQALETIGVAVDADELFHRLIAQASHNRVLVAAVDLIRRDKQLTMMIDIILKRTTHKWVVGHDEILDAIRRRDADAAERAMLAHLNTLNEDIRRYQKTIEDGGDATGRRSIRQAATSP